MAVTILSSLEGWYSFWQGATMIALAAIFVTGIGQFLTGKWLNERQGVENQRQSLVVLALQKGVNDSRTELANAKTDLSNALTKQAETELQLGQLRRLQGPRYLELKEFAQALLGKAKAEKTEVWYQPDDGEAYSFALNIIRGLQMAGWGVAPAPEPIRADPRLPANLPLAMRARGMTSGVCIVAKKLPEFRETDDPVNTLTKAFIDNLPMPCGASQDIELPQGFIRIIVGSKP